MPTSLTDGAVERERIERLEAALRSVVGTWEDPGPMGTLYQMPRAIYYAKSVLNEPVAMTEDEKREQVAKQCEVVAHMAKAIAGVYEDHARLFREVPAHAILTDRIGKGTAHKMEVLGDMLNSMDAVDDTEDDWINPVIRQAQKLWLQIAS